MNTAYPEKSRLRPRTVLYRRSRAHSEFICRLGLPAAAIKAGLRAAWNAAAEFAEIPAGHVQELVRTKYSRPEWNLKF